MDLQKELGENKRQYESGEIGEDKYRERRMAILNRWSNESKRNNKKIEPSHGKQKL